VRITMTYQKAQAPLPFFLRLDEQRSVVCGTHKHKHNK
jgi:hypothetical protein